MLDATYANQVLDGTLGTADFPDPVLPVVCRLMVVNGTDTSYGTELATGGGYTAGTGAPTVTFASSAGKTTSNNTALVVSNMPACTVVGVELWDSSTVPRRLHLGALDTPEPVNTGDTFDLTDGEIALAIA